MDLVGTCPKTFWEEWIAEGDAAGDPPTGEEWHWYTRSRAALLVSGEPDERFYVVAHGRLRGWAPITAFVRIARGGLFDAVAPGYAIVRRGGAVACAVPFEISGFRGLRKRWWDRSIEVPFPDWRTP